MADTNGRLRLSWGQITWGIAVLVAMLGAWYDLRSQQSIVLFRLTRVEVLVQADIYTKSAVDAMRKESETDRADLRKRVERIERRFER